MAIPDVSLLPKLSKILDMDIEGILYGEPHELVGDIAGIISLWPYENKTVSITDIVNGKPLLVYPLSMFLLCGIKNIVICGPKELVGSAKNIIDFAIPKTEIISISYCNNINSFRGNHVVLIDGNSYLYGIDLTRYLQRTIVHKNVISCIACSSEKIPTEAFWFFPFVSVPSLDDDTIFMFEKHKKKTIRELIDKGNSFDDVNIELIGRGMLSFEINTREELSDFETIIQLISKTQHCDISNPDKIIKKRYGSIS